MKKINGSSSPAKSPAKPNKIKRDCEHCADVGCEGHPLFGKDEELDPGKVLIYSCSGEKDGPVDPTHQSSKFRSWNGAAEEGTPQTEFKPSPISQKKRKKRNP